MKQPVQKPKPSLNLLIVILGLTVCVVLIVATLLTGNTPTPAETATPAIEQRPFHYAPRQEPCDSIQPDTTAPHRAHRFKDASINTVLDTVRKWYGVLYAFRKPVDNRFTGTIPKDASLNEIVQLLEAMTPDPIRIRRLSPGYIIVNPNCP